MKMLILDTSRNFGKIVFVERENTENTVKELQNKQKKLKEN